MLGTNQSFASPLELSVLDDTNGFEIDDNAANGWSGYGVSVALEPDRITLRRHSNWTYQVRKVSAFGKYNDLSGFFSWVRVILDLKKGKFAKPGYRPLDFDLLSLVAARATINLPDREQPKGM